LLLVSQPLSEWQYRHRGTIAREAEERERETKAERKFKEK
jgi:hypothetical protein